MDGTGTNLGGNSTTLMLLYLTWISDAARGNQFVGSKTILHQIQATFLNIAELIKDHKLQVDGETLEVRKPPQNSTRHDND